MVESIPGGGGVKPGGTVRGAEATDPSALSATGGSMMRNAILRSQNAIAALRIKAPLTSLLQVAALSAIPGRIIRLNTGTLSSGVSSCSTAVYSCGL